MRPYHWLTFASCTEPNQHHQSVGHQQCQYSDHRVFIFNYRFHSGQAISQGYLLYVRAFSAKLRQISTFVLHVLYITNLFYLTTCHNQVAVMSVMAMDYAWYEKVVTLSATVDSNPYILMARHSTHVVSNFRTHKQRTHKQRTHKQLNSKYYNIINGGNIVFQGQIT